MSLFPKEVKKIKLGIVLKKIEHVHFKLEVRSSVCTQLAVLGGRIDGDYREEWILVLENRTGRCLTYGAQERMVQIIPYSNVWGVLKEGPLRSGGMGSTSGRVIVQDNKYKFNSLKESTVPDLVEAGIIDKDEMKNVDGPFGLPIAIPRKYADIIPDGIDQEMRRLLVQMIRRACLLNGNRWIRDKEIKKLANACYVLSNQIEIAEVVDLCEME